MQSIVGYSLMPQTTNLFTIDLIFNYVRLVRNDTASMGIGENSGKQTLFDIDSVYPNPVDDFFHIQITLIENSDILVKIRSLNGSLVKSFETVYCISGMQELLWPVSDLKPGFYIGVISDEYCIRTFKISVK